MEQEKPKFLKIYCDGGARGNPGPAASAFVVFNEKRQKVFQQGRKIGSTTNNVAEYTAVVMALEWLVESAQVVPQLVFYNEVGFYLDSELVVRQLTGYYKVKNKKLLDIFFKTQRLISAFPGKIFFKHIDRESNKEADRLVNETLDF